MFIEVLSKISVLFIVLAIGALARNKKLLDGDSTRALAKIVLVIALPFLYFHSLATNFTRELLRSVWVLPVFAVGMVAAGYLLAKYLSRFTRLDRPGKATFIYLATFTNCGFLAIPIANALYGTDGVMRVVFFNVGFNLLYWTLGVWTLRNGSAATDKKGASPLRNLINSGTIGLLGGIIVGFTAIRLPLFMLDAAKIMGSATIPLALLVVGSMMSKGKVGNLKAYKNPILLIVLCRLILVPGLALLITGLCGFLSPLARAIIVLQSAMPSASTTPIFISRFGGDSQLAAAGVFATHISSIITVPLFITLLQI
ncbi:MAG: AEC family transporter [Candidatus Omnitrophica bacterium]|nr:AEC family transporter [Candidatus Omnitrophota bacterium]